MKGTFIAAMVIVFLAVHCSPKKPFVVVQTGNPGFYADTAFVAFEELTNPKFAALKEKYQLDTIFHGETRELNRILLVRNWINTHIKIDNAGPYPGDGSVESILDEALKGHGFHCGHYSAVQNALLNAYGYVSRCLLADVGVPVGLIDGEGHHAINEVWLNTYHKWFLSDAKYDYHFEKNGIPLSALEVRDSYLKNKAADISLVKGPGRIVTETYPSLNNRSKEKFARIYTWLSWGRFNNRYSNWPNTNTDFMLVYDDDYFKQHVWLWNGKPLWAYNTEYMTRITDRRAIEWTPNTISSNVRIEADQATIGLRSATPNLQSYQLQESSGAEWKNILSTVVLKLRKNENELRFRTINTAGVTGPEHKIIISR
jgi:hypothetical protein